MKLRRSLAAAAVTAVIAPAAFLAAPSAYATDGADTPVTSETTASTETPGTGETTATTPEETPGTGETTATTPEETPGTGADGNEDAEDESKPDAGQPTPSTTSSTTSPAPSPTESLIGDICEEADFKSTLSGLPSKIVAGSGWKQFKLNLDNSKGERQEDVLLGAVLLYKKDAQGDFTSSLASKYAQIQYFDGESWTSDLSEGGEIGGLISVAAGEKISLKLRLSIKSSAPAGSAVGIAFGIYTDEKDEETCYADESWYSFEVLAAGSKPPAGDNDNKPQEGKPPVQVKPDADKVEDITGNLAQTGSDSSLPVIGLIGGITIVAGAGVVFAVRRRKTVGIEA